MPDLHFSVSGAHVVERAVTPTLALELCVQADQRIENVLLQVQIQIESPRRQYSSGEQSQLLDLFGTPDRWGETLRTMHWTKVGVIVPPFQEQSVVELPVPCTFDFNVAATKYFYALEQGDIPLLLLFSGTIFYRQDDGALQVQRVPWSREATFRLPVSVWKQMMNVYYPNSARLSLRQDIFDRLYRFKCQQGLATWEQTIASLLDSMQSLAAEEQRLRS